MTRPRFSLATVMMVVVASAAAAALFSRLLPHLSSRTMTTTPTPIARTAAATAPAPVTFSYDKDMAGVFVAGIVLTGLTLAAWARHSPALAMLQITLTCLDFLILIGLGELDSERPLLYWFQGSFAVLVVAPLLARRGIEAGMPDEPRRTWWLQTTEAVHFGFLTMLLVLAGVAIQLATFIIGGQALNF